MERLWALRRKIGLGTCLTGILRAPGAEFSGRFRALGLRRGSSGRAACRTSCSPERLTPHVREKSQGVARLIRVLGHELNNSLAPIQSCAGVESGLVSAEKSSELLSESTAALLDDLRQVLGIIRSRTEALARFMAATRTWRDCRNQNCRR